MKISSKIGLLLSLLIPACAYANQKFTGVCSQSGKVVVSGLNSTNSAALTYAGATVTVNVVGGGLATIFSDNVGTPLSNPFTAGSDASFGFYAANGRYTVVCSGTGIPSITVNGDALLNDPAAAGSTFTGSSVTSSTANPATTGFIRQASTDSTCWRNNANSANLCLSRSGAGDTLTWPSALTLTGGLTATTGTFSGVITGTTANLSGAFVAASVTSSGGMIDNTPIGSITPSTGSFTTGAFSGALTGLGATFSAEVGPNVSGVPLGDTAHRWDAFIRNLDVSGTTTGILNGSGTVNTIPKFTAATTIGNSSLSDNGTTVTGTEPLNIGSNSLTAGAGTLASLTAAGSSVPASTTLANNGAMGFSTLSGWFNPLSFGADPRDITAADSAFNTLLTGTNGMTAGGGGIFLNSDNAFKFVTGLNLGSKNVDVMCPGTSSVLTGTGIAIITMPRVSGQQSLRDCEILDPTGNAASIGVDIESSPAGSPITAFDLSHDYVEGTTPVAGSIGVKCHFCLSGSFRNLLVQDWDTGVQIEGNGGSHSNSNNLSGVHSRANNTGVNIAASAQDDNSWFDPINEGNAAKGWNIATGNGVTWLFGGHHENTTATTANVNIFGNSSWVSFGGDYQSPSGKGIVLDATFTGTASFYSPDFLSTVNPITNNGTGFVVVHDPYNMGTPNGTGKTYVWDRGNLTCTNCSASDEFDWTMGFGAKGIQVGVPAADSYWTRQNTSEIGCTTTLTGFTFCKVDASQFSVFNGAQRNNITTTATATRTTTLPDGNSATVLVASFTTTAATTDNVTVTGMTASGHCHLQPTNSGAAGGIASVFVSAKAANQITVTHTATAGWTFDVMCSPI